MDVDVLISCSHFPKNNIVVVMAAFFIAVGLILAVMSPHLSKLTLATILGIMYTQGERGDLSTRSTLQIFSLSARWNTLFIDTIQALFFYQYLWFGVVALSTAL